MTTRQKEFKVLVNESGLKATPARLRLMAIFARTRRPISVRAISTHIKNVDAATIYRNVEALTECGILHRVQLDDRQSYYELASAAHHHHLVCELCGSIADVEKCEVALPTTAVKRAGFSSIRRHALEFYGVCATCAVAPAR